MMLNMDETLDEEDLSIIFDELKVQNSLYEPLSRKDDFSSKPRCRRAADDEFCAYFTFHGRVRTRTMTKQANSHSSSLSDLKLSNSCYHSYQWF